MTFFEVLKGKTLSENRIHFPTHLFHEANIILRAKPVRYYKEKRNPIQTNISQENIYNKSLTKW